MARNCNKIFKTGLIFLCLCIIEPIPIKKSRSHLKMRSVKNRRHNFPVIICGIDSYEDDMYGCQEDPDDLTTKRTFDFAYREKYLSEDKGKNTKEVLELPEVGTNATVATTTSGVTTVTTSRTSTTTSRTSTTTTDWHQSWGMPSGVTSDDTTEFTFNIEDIADTLTEETTEATTTMTKTTISLGTGIFWYKEREPKVKKLPSDVDFCVDRAKCLFPFAGSTTEPESINNSNKTTEFV